MNPAVPARLGVPVLILAFLSVWSEWVVSCSILLAPTQEMAETEGKADMAATRVATRGELEGEGGWGATAATPVGAAMPATLFFVSFMRTIRLRERLMLRPDSDLWLRAAWRAYQVVPAGAGEAAAENSAGMVTIEEGRPDRVVTLAAVGLTDRMASSKLSKRIKILFSNS